MLFEMKRESQRKLSKEKSALKASKLKDAF